jgi:hypothetical protein
VFRPWTTSRRRRWCARARGTTRNGTTPSRAPSPRWVRSTTSSSDGIRSNRPSRQLPGPGRRGPPVTTAALLDALSALFESMWQCAVPVNRVPQEDGGEHLAAEDVDLIGLLVAGNTDERIARSLGWHMRTVSRHLHQLMARVGARTRLPARRGGGSPGLGLTTGSTAAHTEGRWFPACHQRRSLASRTATEQPVSAHRYERGRCSSS